MYSPVFEYARITKFPHYFFGVFLYGFLLSLQPCRVNSLASGKAYKR
ncbi:hypothetical protein QW060_09130 [Myroides ceti]|uniref:Uncharacterized protein n=1 Tax=Paenimyroides ceti TaxID=395087 RepID=A0ABT8CS08_9FLAO|nr:hypothetical protein [Paenimyroides ceti]MDN3707297.1 hypothetical protein [Paenimyroides ceti]